MRVACWLSFVLLVGILGAGAQEAATDLSRGRFTLQDGGAAREFEVAVDEVQMSGSNRVERVSGARTGAQLRQAARSLRAAPGERPQMVLYEAGVERSPATRRVLTGEIVVKLRPGEDAAAVAAAHGLRYARALDFAPGYVLFEAPEVGGALEVLDRLRASGRVTTAEPQLARQQQKRLIPSDTYFAQQWHLKNTGQGGSLAGTDVAVTDVWDTYRGRGVRIGIVDDGLQLTHPDLLPNIDTINDRDWNDATPDDPSPNVNIDFHGTACAGVAAARGDNALGISGAAPEATLVGLRLIAGPTTDLQEAEAMSWKSDLIQIKSNSWGPYDDGRTLQGPGALTLQALETATQTGRGGLGSIFVWAGGNGGDLSDNSNNDGYANSRFVIAVGAIGNNGRRSYYSELGANLLVSAPSNGASLGIVTTDLRGEAGYNATGVPGELSNRDYTNSFGGTSSACPLVAGCIALILEANPLLGWRDVHEILARSATKVDPTDADWITNGAGFHFNHKYGAGMVNSAQAVALALNWTNLPAEINAAQAQTGLSVAIPDNNANGITRQFNFSDSNVRVERVTVRVNIDHTSRGQLAMTLISPSGTESRLTEKHSDSNDHFRNWTFSTVRHWGENSQGTWTLKIADLATNNVGKVLSAAVTLYGTTAGPVNQPPRVTSAQISTSGTAFSDEVLKVTGVQAIDPEDDPVTLSYRWLVSEDGVNFLAIPGATASTFALSSAQLAKLVRCEIRPEAAGKQGVAFTTEAVAVIRRPQQLTRTGMPYSFDTDLFVPQEGLAVSRSVIINEFSQGAAGKQEWVELLVQKNTDLRGYTLGDRLGTYCTFKDNPLWSRVRAGTLIVIYNGPERDALIPAVPDLDPSDGILILPHNSTVLTAGYWEGLSNSAVESIVVKDSTGTLVDGLSLNNQNVYDPKLGIVGAVKCARYIGDTDFGADLLSNWVIQGSSSATPGAGNSPENSNYIAALFRIGAVVEPQYRLGAGSDAVPGLTLDPATGILSGTPQVPGGGLFVVRIERFTESEVTEQSFTLVVADLAGSVRVPAGQTWTVNGNAVVAGDLTVEGRIQTEGHHLTVQQLLNVSPGGVIENPAGLVEYRQRAGARISGQTSLLPDPVNDVLDSDGDGQSNLLEFMLGSNPSSASDRGFIRVTTVDGRLELEYDELVGATGATILPQVSDDLATWKSGPAHTEPVSAVGDGEIRRVKVRDLGAGPKRFIRLQVSR